MPKPLPLISIIIPTYNRADAVCQAVRSAMRQTYTSREILVVDDGSKDDTLERLSQFGTQIRVISSRNMGAAAARNRGVDAASGELVAFLDSDDAWLPAKLQLQVEALRGLGEDFEACFTDCRYVGNPNMSCSAFEEAGLRSFAPFAPLEKPFFWILGRYTPIYIQSVLVRHSIVKEMGGFDEGLPVGEDTDFLFRLAFRTQLCFVSEKLVEIDRTPSRAVGLMELYHRQSERMYSARKSMFTKWLALPQLTEPIRKEVESHLREMLYEWTAKKISQKSFGEALTHMREIRQVGDSNVRIMTRLVQRALRRIKMRLSQEVPLTDRAGCTL